jgi:hypothetical protein
MNSSVELDAAESAICRALLEGDSPKKFEDEKEEDAKPRYATFEIMANAGERALEMLQVPPLKQSMLIQSVADERGEVWIAVLPLAQGLFALANGESSKEDRIKAVRYITRMNPATGAVLHGLVKRVEIASIEPCGNGPQLVVRADGLWTLLTAIAPNKIVMPTRMKLYEAVRMRFGGVPLPRRRRASSSDEEEEPRRKRAAVKHHTASETKAFDALKMLHVEQQAARTAEINDVIRLEHIIATGRDNKLRALREEVRLRAEMAALPREGTSSMMMQ